MRQASRIVRAALTIGAVVATGALAVGSSASAKSHRKGHLKITSTPWGTANGHAVNLYTLTNHHGMKVKITNYGGVVQSIWVPDRHGRLANVALGFSNLDDYVNDFQHQPWPASGGSGDTYFGAIIGRYANRIAGAQFTLNGHTYPLGSGPPSRLWGADT